MTREEYIEKIKKIESLKKEIQTLELETNSFETNSQNELIEKCSKFVGDVIRQDWDDNCARFMHVKSLRRWNRGGLNQKGVPPVVLEGPAVTINVGLGQESAHIDVDCEVYVFDSVEKSKITFLTVDEKERAEEFIKKLLNQIWEN